MDSSIRGKGASVLCTTLTFLLVLGCSTKEQHETLNSALVRACSGTDLVAIKNLLRAGADPNASLYEETCLGASIYTVTESSFNNVHALLEGGANPNLPTRSHRASEAPLLLICRHGEFADGGYTAPIAELLIKHGARLDARDIEGNTPFILAAANDSEGRVLKVVLAASPQLEARNYGGDTALLATARKVTVRDNIKILLEAGADVGTRDNSGRDALRIIREQTTKDPSLTRAYSDAVKALLKAGAK